MLSLISVFLSIKEFNKIYKNSDLMEIDTHLSFLRKLVNLQCEPQDTVDLQYSWWNRLILSTHIRKVAQQTGVSYGSTRTVLKKHFHLHPYKITSVHEMKDM
jgi:hypothetical protein